MEPEEVVAFAHMINQPYPDTFTNSQPIYTLRQNAGIRFEANETKLLTEMEELIDQSVSRLHSHS